MKKCLILLAILMAVEAEGMVPLQRPSVALKTDVKIRSSKDKNRRDEYTKYGNRTAVEKDTKQTACLAIEVRNMSPRVVKNIRVVYQLYELQFEQASNKTIIYRLGSGRSREKLVPAGKGELTIEQIKPLEVKVVESEPIESSYRSTQDMTKIVSQTKTSGRKFGGYIVEYFVGDELVKRDASSQRLHETYLRSLQAREGTAPSLMMKVQR
jgi:hypothetical protein